MHEANRLQRKDIKTSCRCDCVSHGLHGPFILNAVKRSVWRYTKKRVTLGKTKTVKTVKAQPPCDECSDEMKKTLGCGYDERYKGKAEGRSAIDEDDTRTCPEYFAQTPFVQSVFEHYHDYTRGALGPVWKLPSLLYDCLRILEGELADWDRKQSEKLDRSR